MHEVWVFFAQPNNMLASWLCRSILFSFPCPVGCQRLSFGRGRCSHDVFCSGVLGIRVPDTFPLVTDVCFSLCAWFLRFEHSLLSSKQYELFRSILLPFIVWWVAEVFPLTRAFPAWCVFFSGDPGIKVFVSIVCWGSSWWSLTWYLSEIWCFVYISLLEVIGLQLYVTFYACLCTQVWGCIQHMAEVFMGLGNASGCKIRTDNWQPNVLQLCNQIEWPHVCIHCAILLQDWSNQHEDAPPRVQKWWSTEVYYLTWFGS